MSTQEYQHPESIKEKHLIATIGDCNYWIIPKCGSTSVLYDLIKKYHPEIGIFKHRNKFDRWVHKIYKNKLYYITPFEARNNGKYNFTFVRDPIERFISLYKDFSKTRNHIKGLFGKDPKTILDYIRSHQSDEEQLDVHLRSMNYYLKDFNGDIFSIEDLIGTKLNTREFAVEIDMNILASVKEMWMKDYTYMKTSEIEKYKQITRINGGKKILSWFC